MMKWLYLYGASKTGKSTLGEIIELKLNRIRDEELDYYLSLPRPRYFSIDAIARRRSYESYD